jgi:hypothetical protein
MKTRMKIYAVMYLILTAWIIFYASFVLAEELELPIGTRLVSQEQSCEEFGTNCPGTEPLQGEITAEVIKSLSEIEPSAGIAEWTPETEVYE